MFKTGNFGFVKGNGTIAVDTRTTIEAHIRVLSTRETGRWGLHRSELKDIAQKITWAPSKRHPDGVTWWGYPTAIDSKGETKIGDDAAVKYFDNNQGHLMLKIVSEMKGGEAYFVAPTRRGNKVYAMDETESLREGANGDESFVYSIPFHNLVAGERSSWFYVVRLAAVPNDNTKVRIWVDKVTVTRGKNHFRVKLEDGLYFRTLPQNLLLEVVKRDQNLRDLGIKQILELYETTIEDGVCSVIRG